MLQQCIDKSMKELHSYMIESTQLDMPSLLDLRMTHHFQSCSLYLKNL